MNLFLSVIPLVTKVNVTDVYRTATFVYATIYKNKLHIWKVLFIFVYSFAGYKFICKPTECQYFCKQTEV